MKSMRCPQHHEVAENANFCHVCGIPLHPHSAFRRWGDEIFEQFSQLDQRSSLPLKFESLASRRVRQFGRNHEYMALAVAGNVGEMLTSAQLGDLIMARFPDFSRGSLLFNDHAEGNKGACRCAGTSDRIFDRVGRGFYVVRPLGLSTKEVKDSNPRIDEPRGEMFSEWLFGGAIEAINEALGTSQHRVEILSGNRGGLQPSIGIRVLGQQAWAIGLDKYFDFDIDGSRPPAQPPYCGWRGGSSYAGSGEEGRQRHHLLKLFFPEHEWLSPNQLWSTHRTLPFGGEGDRAFRGDRYRKFVVETFVTSFFRLLEGASRDRDVRPQRELLHQ